MPSTRAKLSYLHIAPRKVRLVADLIRGMDADKAELQLRFSQKRAARPLLKLLQSVQANAKDDKQKKEGSSLYIKSITVDQGPAYKRFMPRARGRATLIKKITSHVRMEVEQRQFKTEPKDGKAAQKRK